MKITCILLGHKLIPDSDPFVAQTAIPGAINTMRAFRWVKCQRCGYQKTVGLPRDFITHESINNHNSVIIGRSP